MGEHGRRSVVGRAFESALRSRNFIHGCPFLKISVFYVMVPSVSKII
jgi:hypothetical protein